MTASSSTELSSPNPSSRSPSMPKTTTSSSTTLPRKVEEVKGYSGEHERCFHRKELKDRGLPIFHFPKHGKVCQDEHWCIAALQASKKLTGLPTDRPTEQKSTCRVTYTLEYMKNDHHADNSRGNTRIKKKTQV